MFHKLASPYQPTNFDRLTFEGNGAWAEGL